MIVIDTHWDHEPLRIATEYFQRTLGISDTCDIFVSSGALPVSLNGATTGVKDKVRIILNNDSVVQPIPVLEVLAHEMVHAHQLNRGDLILPDAIFGANQVLVWKGERIPALNALILAKMGVAPWEPEAYGIQKELYLSLLDYVRSTYVKVS